MIHLSRAKLRTLSIVKETVDYVQTVNSLLVTFVGIAWMFGAECAVAEGQYVRGLPPYQVAWPGIRNCRELAIP